MGLVTVLPSYTHDLGSSHYRSSYLVQTSTRTAAEEDTLFDGIPAASLGDSYFFIDADDNHLTDSASKLYERVAQPTVPLVEDDPDTDEVEGEGQSGWWRVLLFYRPEAGVITNRQTRIVSAREIGPGREGELTDIEEHRYTRRFLVRTTLPWVTALEVLAAPGLPVHGDAYDLEGQLDWRAVVVNRRASQSDPDDPTVWEVTITYDDVDGPLCQPPEVSWSTAHYTRAVQQDLSDPPKKIANSAGVPFDPPAERDGNRLVLKITRAEIDYDPARALRYADAVNADDFLGFAPGKAKMKPITAEREGRPGYHYWRVSYEIEFADEGWKFKPLDQGYSILTGDPPKLVPVTLGPNGAPLSAPILLNGTGGRLAANAAPVYLEFQLYPTREFGELNLAY